MTLSTKPFSRRSVIAGSAAVVTAIPAVGLATWGASEGAPTEELVREFSKKLLTEHPPCMTLGEWIERKRAAVVLQVLIGDKPEPWEPWEPWEITFMWAMEDRA